MWCAPMAVCHGGFVISYLVILTVFDRLIRPDNLYDLYNAM